MNRLLERIRSPYLLADEKRWLKRMLIAPGIRLEGPPIPRPNEGEIRLFMLVRNEMLRLPYCLKHHVDMGVDRIIVLDNESSDGTKEWLREHECVHLLTTSRSYKYEEVWRDVLLRRYGVGCWCLMLDADELLVYPDAEWRDLRELTAYMDHMGWNAMSTVLVDMYPEGALDACKYEPGTPFLEAAPYFDAPAYKERPFPFRGCKGAPATRLVGGPRWRTMGEETCCTNFPLVRFHPGMFVRAGRHAVEFASISPVRGALLHFKFFQDFIPKARLEAERGVHYDGARHYRNYWNYVQQSDKVSFFYEESVRYEKESRQLLDLGVMKTVPGWAS